MNTEQIAECICRFAPVEERLGTFKMLVNVVIVYVLWHFIRTSPDSSDDPEIKPAVYTLFKYVSLMIKH